MTFEERFWSKVDKTSSCWTWKSSTDRQGYGHIKNGKKLLYAHRISYEMVHGLIPPGLQIDHICHNRACVNPSHLRTVTRKQNAENAAGAQLDKKHGIRGVHWHKSSKKWRGQVIHNGVTHHLGPFTNKLDAEKATVKLRLELFTHNEKDKARAIELGLI